MRILVAVHGLPPASIGGTELYAERISAALAAAGDELLVVAREDDSARPELSTREENRGERRRILFVSHAWRSVTSLRESWEHPRLLAAILPTIDRFRPDAALVLHLTGLSTGLLPALAARGIATALVLQDYWMLCHRGQLLDRDLRPCAAIDPAGCGRCLGAAGAGSLAFGAAALLRRLDRLVPRLARRLRSAGEGAAALAGSADPARAARERAASLRDTALAADLFVAPSVFLLERFVATGWPRDRFLHRSLGIDRDRFRTSPPSPPDRPLRVGFLGSLTVAKGPEVLLDAFDRLPPEAATLDLLGNVAPYHGDDSLARRLNGRALPASVRRRGGLPPAGVPAVLSELDLLVVPSIWPENAPFVILEAFAAGLPVVASDIGGIPELVRPGENGILVPPGDADALADGILALAGDRLRLATLAAGAAASPVPSMDEDARETRELLGDLVAARREGR